MKINLFDQALALPEYHDSFSKHNPPHIAFYRGATAAKYLDTSEITFYEIKSEVIFGHAEILDLNFPLLTKLIRQADGPLVFEIDNLVRRPDQQDLEYVKGIAVTKPEDGTFCLADFIVEHPGVLMTGGGVNMGWHYSVDNKGTWKRQASPQDCTCDNESIHEHHLSGLVIIENHLKCSGLLTKIEVSGAPNPERENVDPLDENY